VRQEDFGLLFYTQSGPRLYFLPSADLLQESFFTGNQNLSQWLSSVHAQVPPTAAKIRSLEQALSELAQKGVLVEF
jgi:putative mycofactocin binding protein MftB